MYLSPSCYRDSRLYFTFTKVVHIYTLFKSVFFLLFYRKSEELLKKMVRGRARYRAILFSMPKFFESIDQGFLMIKNNDTLAQMHFSSVCRFNELV